MNRSKSLTIFLLMIPCLLTGCWDLKNPQDINYFTAIGFDYKDKQFTVYAQMLDFASIAGPDNAKPSEHVPVWTGTGTGDTAASAFNDLYESTQLRVFFGHVNAIVFSENIMNHGLNSVFDVISRYHELRYTPWIFGTKNNIEELLSASPFFNMSPLTSILHQPQENYKQKSMLPPVMLREFITSYREPGRTALLPGLQIIKDDWKANMKPKTLLDRDGVFSFYEMNYNGYFDTPDIMGLRFVIEETDRTPLVVRDGADIYTEIALRNPKVKITPLMKGDRITFRLETSLDGIVMEVIEPMTEQQIEKLAEEHVYEEIMSTYEKALEKKVDLYQLEHVLYRKNNKEWKRVKEMGGLKLDKDSLDLHVEVNVVSSEKLKLLQTR